MNAARIRFALSVIALGAVTGTACGQAGDDPSPCASITADKSRLQCYDAQEATRVHRRGAATASPVPVPPPPPSAAAPSSEFGLEGEALAKKRAAETPKDAPRPAEQVVAKVTAVTGRGKGDYRIQLDNGQLWMESQRTGGEAPEPGETVTIRPGLLGSYFMEREAGLALRVKRVK
jgi:hypothetical protein